MKPSLWRILLAGAAIFLAVYLIGAINVWRKIPESYAAWTTGNLIVDYLDTHSNQWPRNWEDLEQATNCQRYVPIAKLREKVKVEWRADFTALLEAATTNSRTSIPLVTRPDGSKLYAVWGRDTDPNVKILGYLNWTPTQTNSTSSGATTN